jgi:hypothetical protein
MRKAMTDAIVLVVLDDKDREKASALAARLAQVLDPATVKVTAPARMAELRVDGIDISITKEELRNALALAAGCGGAAVRRRSWLGLGALPISRGEEACPGRKDCTGMVHCEGRSHRQEALVVF